MALKTAQQYLESLYSLHPTVYILGEKVANPYDHPLLRPMINGVAKTYDLEHDPEGATHLVDKNERGEQVSRFVKFYQGPDDLLAKVRMLRSTTATRNTGRTTGNACSTSYRCCRMVT